MKRGNPSRKSHAATGPKGLDVGAFAAGMATTIATVHAIKKPSMKIRAARIRVTYVESRSSATGIETDFLRRNLRIH
jgi:hypothetical protein